MIGSDDVLACFIAGNAFTWDDWFRLETLDDSLQPTIDMLLNVSVFMWFGAVCPWASFLNNNVIPIYRLIPLGVLVLLLRRLPMILAFQKHIRELEEWRHAVFTGWFGPIGVSAVFYLYVAREFLREIQVDGHEREDATHLMEVLNVVVWFLTICSIVCHGLSVPLGKLGFHLPRTISMALSSERLSRNSSRSRSGRSSPGPHRAEPALVQSFRRRRPTTSERGPATFAGPGIIASATGSLLGCLGRLIHRHHNSSLDSTANADRSVGFGGHPEISRPMDARIIGRAITSTNADSQNVENDGVPELNTPSSVAQTKRAQPPQSRDGRPLEAPSLSGVAPTGWQRSIRFPDDPTTRTAE